jgi:hypothetical protein
MTLAQRIKDITGVCTIPWKQTACSFGWWLMAGADLY